MTEPTAQGSRHPGTGETIAGRYRLSALLGQGGLASVYRAHDLSTGRDVALKQLIAGDASTRVRALFEREFVTLAQLQHPHVIAVYDYGVRDRSARLRARIAELSADARFLLESQALAFRETFSDAEYRALLPNASTQAVERAIAELLASRAVVTDGAVYTLANHSWTQAASALDPSVASERHRALANMYHGRSLVAESHRWFAGGFHAAFDLARGDIESAIKVFEEVIAMTGPDAEGRMRCAPMWVSAQSGFAEALFQSGRIREARAVASAALEVCERRSIGAHAFDLVRTLALAEAKLGIEGAAERLERLEERQRALGVTGLRLGLTYEARARMAIWQGDAAAFERYARATAKEYRYADRSSLGTRYERLMNEAGRNGLQTSVRPADFAVTSSAYSEVIASDEERTVLERKPNEAAPADRARSALEQICKANGVAAGHLFLVDSGVPVLAASRGERGPDAALALQIRDHITTVALQTQELEDMLTGELEEGDDGFKTVDIEGTEYTLLTLQCVVNQVGTIAGVVALKGGAAKDARTQTRLLQTIAASLMKHG